MSDDPEEDQTLDDEVKPDQGLERYWLYVHGEEVRMLAGLAAGIFLIIWCGFLVFDSEGTTPGVVVLICAMGSGVVWLILDDQLKKMAQRGWAKSRRSKRTERLELSIAIALWLLICLAIIAIILQKWFGGRRYLALFFFALPCLAWRW